MTEPTPDPPSPYLDEATQHVKIDKIIELTAASVLLSDRVTELTDAATAERVAAKTERRRFLITLSAIALVVLAMLTFGMIVQVSGVSSRHAITETTKTISDCVRPSGRCYQDNQRRTGVAIDQLNRVTVLAAACAPTYASVEPISARVSDIQKCIQAGLR